MSGSESRGVQRAAGRRYGTAVPQYLDLDGPLDGDLGLGRTSLSLGSLVDGKVAGVEG